MYKPKSYNSSSAAKKKTKLERKIQEDIPGFQVRFKDEEVPWHLRMLWWFTGKTFNKRIWSHVTTTVYPDVWFPSREHYDSDPTARFGTLAHEYVHLRDMKADGMLWFTFLYGFPQSIALLSLLGFLGFFGFLWAPLFSLFSFFLFLFALIPFPAVWRSDYEAKAYIMSMCCKRWSGRSLEGYPEWLSDIFSGSGYWFMGPKKGEALRYFQEEREKVEGGAYDEEEIYEDVRKIWLE